jgi:hypothetical protein
MARCYKRLPIEPPVAVGVEKAGSSKTSCRSNKVGSKAMARNWIHTFAIVSEKGEW